MENTTYTIGLMSGTSLDGVDIAYVSFSKDNSFKILDAETIPYSKDWFKILKNISSYDKGDPYLKKVDSNLGIYYGELVKGFIERKKIDRIDFIASHGHTVHHQPKIGYTLQIGCGKKIYEATKVKVVYDFRTQDVLLGGQGAPLVPIVDRDLFGKFDYCLNLGGFANISYQEGESRCAYDICPVNTVLNFYVQKIKLPYDKDGKLASVGKVDYDLLYELNQNSFYSKSPPKSLGIEFVNSEVIPLVDRYHLSLEDILSTYVQHIVQQLYKNMKQGNILITGGGAYNLYLIDELKKQIGVKIVIPDKVLIEYKEALAFTYLGKLRLEGKDNCLSSVTGAIKNHCSAKVVGN